ncbi:hypothetical protein [Solibacillus sp. FSL H8-0538]|uniref:hypothetical protein n=1 Tax=Solibacillus sp. FSL H8-0538 TaxID=2921400 RepID=UPI0030F857EC
MSWTVSLEVGSQVVEVTTNGWGNHERTYSILNVVSISSSGRVSLSNGVMLDKLGREWGKHSRILDIKYCELTDEILEKIKMDENIKQIDKMMGDLNGIKLHKQNPEMVKIIHRQITELHTLTFGNKANAI